MVRDNYEDLLIPSIDEEIRKLPKQLIKPFIESYKAVQVEGVIERIFSRLADDTPFFS